MHHSLGPLGHALSCALAIVMLVGTTAWPAPPTGSKSAHAPATDEIHRVLWEIAFEDDISMEEYAHQLDFFNIEIGAVSKAGKIEYVSKLSNLKPQKRLGDSQHEHRLAIGWTKGNLHVVDRKLLSRAGVSSNHKDLLHYFPTALQANLATLERSYCQGDPHAIRRTRFSIRTKSQGEGYEFVVVEQDPPLPTSTTAVRARGKAP
ncbi:MAG TPA: hypothetical protein VHV08_02955 [Pirellulales bacterium]|nr:hypothetical protein [Pirellulales bacterium]